MLATALAVLALFQATDTAHARPKRPVVTIRVNEGDATDRSDTTKHKPKKFIPAPTEAQLASAFADPGARALLTQARAARLGQDSSIASYDASTVQRFTVGVGLSKFARDRILFRSESSSRVRWARGVGAQIDMTGKRAAAPVIGGDVHSDIERALSPVPYYPGRDALWLGLDVVKETDEADDVINPMSKNAEAFYTYKSGESVSFRLPDGKTIQLRELEVRPRKADWHAVIGSFWFDVSSGQLVRAAFRMSQPINLLDEIDNDDDDDKPGPVARAFIPNMSAGIEGVAVEYGLYQGKYWLPRTEAIEGKFTMGFARMPMSIEERFTYASVNVLDTMPAMRDRLARIQAPPPPPGTDSVTARRLARKYRDSVSVAREKNECSTTGTRSARVDRYDRTLPVMVFTPCDTAKLAHSPTLPPSIFDPGEDVFGDADRDALLEKTKSMMPPMPYGFPKPTIAYGPDLQRYNRVEGLSLSAEITEPISPGMSLEFAPRMGTADRVFNADFSLERTNGLGTRALTLYRRLDAANDWGQPLSFGAGLSAFLFGRDEGLYYRASGAELSGDNLFGAMFDWRVFTERQSDAIARTNVSLPKAFGSDGFSPLGNIDAARLTESGAAIRKVSTFGENPDGFRLLSDLRLEGAGGDSTYGRGALDLTLSRPIGRAFGRDFSAAITGGAGTSVGGLPVQRYWYLGGTNSVRGQDAGSMAGSSYWLTRTEFGYGPPGWRRLAFFDLAWAGDRTKWSEMGRPASGVGLGWSFMDGLVRLDVARGLYPAKQWTTALYLNARF